MTQAPPPPPSDPNDPLGSPGGSVPPPPPPPPPPAPAGGYPPPTGGDAPPPAYGSAPPPPPAGGYGGQPMGYGADGGVGADYADWPKRAYAFLIDYVGPAVVAGIIYGINRPIGWLAYLAAIGWGAYNGYLAGQTGQSYGKKIAGTRLISEATGEPPGGGLGVGRFFLHVVDSVPCIPVGFLWPLWDSKRQTFSDKILKTVVVNHPTGR